jgi:hypothetical protein
MNVYKPIEQQSRNVYIDSDNERIRESSENNKNNKLKGVYDISKDR